MRDTIDFEELKSNLPLIHDYWQKTEVEMEAIIANRQEENFWLDLQKVILVDTKLVLLRSYVTEFDYSGFTEEEIIQNIEEDYVTYTKELCGYNLKDVEHPSIIFGKGR
jgi:hypothetical protein